MLTLLQGRSLDSKPVKSGGKQVRFGDVSEREALERASRSWSEAEARDLEYVACFGRARSINTVPATAECDGWRQVGITIDSGAADSVADPESFPGYAVRKHASPICYQSPTGERITNTGEQDIALLIREGSLRGMRFQLTSKLKKPLAAVKRIVEAGHAVAFAPPDMGGSFILNLATFEETHGFTNLSAKNFPEFGDRMSRTVNRTCKLIKFASLALAVLAVRIAVQCPTTSASANVNGLCRVLKFPGIQRCTHASNVCSVHAAHCTDHSVNARAPIQRHQPRVGFASHPANHLGVALAIFGSAMCQLHVTMQPVALKAFHGRGDCPTVGRQTSSLPHRRRSVRIR